MFREFNRPARRFSGRSPPPEMVALTRLALALSPNGDAPYVPVDDPLTARRYISFHDSISSPYPISSFCSGAPRALRRGTNFLPPPRIARRKTLRSNDGRLQLCELGSLRWIDSMFSLTQVIHLSCLRRPRAIDPDVRRVNCLPQQ